MIETLLRSPTLDDFDFSLIAIEKVVTVNAGEVATLVNVADAMVLRSTGSTTENAFDLVATLLTGSELLLEDAVVECNNGTASGMSVSWLANGAARIYLRTRWLDRFLDVVFSRSVGQTVNVFQNYVANSLGKQLTDEMTEAAASGTKPLFTTLDDATPSYTRNVDCWIGADWTGRPVWNSAGGGAFGGALISPCHLIGANHASPSGTIRFVTNDNQIVERNIVGSASVNLDIRVLKLDSDVPSSVKFYKVLPANWRNYIKTFACPVILTDAQQNCIARQWLLSTFNVSGTLVAAVATATYTSGVFAQFSENIIGGDSGSASFFLIDGELVASGANYQAGSAVAVHEMISSYTSEVNAAMTTLGGGYQLTPVDLTGFNNYG